MRVGDASLGPLALGSLGLGAVVAEEQEQGLGEGGGVARVLLAGAALALAMLALALLATWVLAARVRPDPKAAFFAVFEDRIR